MYERSIAYGYVERFKRICSIKEKLNSHLEQLKQWLVKRGYREDHVYSKTEWIKLVERTVLYQIRNKKVDDNITLVISYHQALNRLYEILLRAHKHVLKSPRLLSAVPSPPRVAFRNPKRIREKLVRSKLKEFIHKLLAPIFVVFLTMIYVKCLKVEISFKVRLPRKNTF